ncbi:MAG TPA: S-methyl-5-thioribose-1-phosphate isomerase [Candidatus Ozemobacteraceae bacterium]|nr:S-methyl-5-thioribose-1-phosphate isomerase [Candidatus Ozemobacteraceae bacterium]
MQKELPMIPTVQYQPETDTVSLLDQTRLPCERVMMPCASVDQMCEAIRALRVRGAPAIGVAAAFGLYIGLREYSGSADGVAAHLEAVATRLAETRPTAVNLFWALNRASKAIQQQIAAAPAAQRLKAARDEALRQATLIMQEDIDMCRAIGFYGAAYLLNGDTWLTHCNAGALATGGYGTALGVFRAAKEQNKRFSVFVDETRPLLQGARLTAWELLEEGIDATLICDNMAASLMAAGKIQGIVVGADRITAEGWVANKIGTYGLAVLAHYHQVPFYVAAPVSTFDLGVRHGREIVIEQRSADEVAKWGGIQTAPTGMPVYNPAFDVTPPDLVTAIFTNLGVLKAPYAQSIHETLHGAGLDHLHGVKRP